MYSFPLKTWAYLQYNYIIMQYSYPKAQGIDMCADKKYGV